MKEITVSNEDDGIRLDRWFQRHFPALTHGELQKMLRKKLVRLDGGRAEAATRIAEGQVVRLPDIDESAPKRVYEDTPRLTPQEMDAVSTLRQSVLYGDGDMVAFNKPSGLATQGGSKISVSVDGVLDAVLGGDVGQGRLVHRLDRDTSGVLLVACNVRAAAALTKAFREKTTEKTYLALVLGVPEMPEGEIRLPLAKHGVIKEKMQVDMEEGKPAITRYQVLESAGRKLSWVWLFPETGRTHQLRVHMAEIGHPIIGDGKYGGEEAFVEGIAPRLHLHALALTIPSVMGRTLDVKAPLTGHMKETAKLLGLDQHAFA